MFRPQGYYERSPVIAENHDKCESGELYQCDFCSEGWLSETEIHIHRTLKHAEELESMLKDDGKHPVCFICLTRQEDIPTLLKHLKSEHMLSSEKARRIERDIYACDDCCQIFFNKAMLVVHIEMTHKRKARSKYIECPKCPKKIRTDCIWAHFQFHQIQSIASCPICLDKCKDRKDLREHVKTHPSCYTCTTCNYDTRKPENFQQHLDQHGQLEEIMDCKSVDDSIKRFFIPRVGILRWRYYKLGAYNGLSLPRSVHVCVLCREICTTGGQMRRHVEHHERAKEEKKLYVCRCGEEFFNNVLLKHHVFKLKGNHKAHQGKVADDRTIDE